MSKSSVAVVRDTDGAVHYASRDSKFVRDGLADGSLVDIEEAPDVPTDAPSGDSADTKQPDRRPRNRQRNTRTSDGDGHESVAGPTVDA